LSILFIATTLRAPITAVAPLLDMIRGAFSLSPTEVGMLISLPLLAFAVISPFAAKLAQAYGLERSLLAALCITAMGIIYRSAGGIWGLYTGTLIIGSGIAILNVLLPGLLKREFPSKVAMLTAIYALTMGAVAGVSSAIAVPIAHSMELGWRFALGVAILLPVVSGIIWFPLVRGRLPVVKNASASAHEVKIWRSPIAWQVTLFFGLDSFVNYAAISWLPAILRDAGYSAAEAGTLHGVLQFSTALPALVLIPIIGHLKDQRLAAFVSAVIAMFGLTGFLLAPGWAFLWTLFLGFGIGAGLILGLAFVSLRAGTSQQTAALSGMAQSIGYFLAASAPPLMGELHQYGGNWHAALAMCAIFCLIMAVLGLYAGRAVRVSDMAT
jgi:CP family cyanate transporter-like MFS transporter